MEVRIFKVVAQRYTIQKYYVNVQFGWREGSKGLLDRYLTKKFRKFGQY